MSYQLDPTASLEANLVVGEPIQVRDSASEFGGLIFIPNAPFFSKDFALEYTDGAGNSRVLTIKKDYNLVFPLVMRDLPNGVGVYSAISLIQPGLSGSVRPTYRAVGGNIRINTAAVLQFLRNRQINPLITRYVSVPFPIEYADADKTIVYPSDTFDTLSTLITRRGVLFLTVDALPLPPDQAVVQYDGLPQKKTGELLVGQTSTSTGGSGGTGTIADTVKVEGGNAAPVVVAGTVSVAGLGAVAKDSSIQQLIAAVEAGAGTSGGALESGGNLQAVAQATGVETDAAYTGANKASVISLLKGMFARLASSLNIRALSSTTDSITTVPSGTQDVRVTTAALPAGAALENGNLLSLSQTSAESANWLSGINDKLGQNLSVTVVNHPTTQAVSAANLPLPANAAQESGGNLQTIRAAVGSQSDAPYLGTGDSSLLSSVRGVYAAIKSVLNIRALSSSTDSVAIQGGNTSAVKVDGSQVTQPISAASLPLPSGAAQEAGGNLQAISANTQNTNALIGTATDGAYAGTGAATLVSVLKGIYARLAGTLNIRTLSSASDSVRIETATTLPVATNQLPVSLGKKASSSSLAVTLASDESPVPVTSSAGALALDSSIQALIQAVENQVSFDSTIWFDSTVTPVVYYVRREVADPVTRAVTVTWETMSGQPATPNVANLSAVADDKSVATQSVQYLAQAYGAGYAPNDQLIHFYGLDVNNTPPVVAYSFWFNATGGNTLAQAPTAGDYASSSSQTVSVTSTVLPANAAQESGGNLESIKSSIGDVSDAAYAGVGSSTVIAGLKGVWSRLGSVLNIRALSSSSDSVTIVPSGVQAVSASALPLPSDAARETGNLQNLANATGAVADAAYTGSGSASLVSILKGLHLVMSGQLQTRNLSSATDSITVVPSGTQQVSLASIPLPANAAREDGNLQVVAAGVETGNLILTDINDKLAGTVQVSVVNQPATQPISATALPLPSGAARETGNLQTIAASVGSSAPSVVPPTGGSGSLGWLSGIYQKLLDGIGVTVTQLPSLPSGNNTIGKVEVTNLPTTQPVSATSLPLPTGAARETGGNLEIAANKSTDIATSTGSTSDAAYNGTGNASLISAVKGVYTRLAGTLNTRALSSSTDSVTTVPSGTQQVSASSLPLPSGAATEDGNLLLISAATTETVAAIGSTVDAAYTGANNTSMVGVLKGIYVRLTSALNIRALSSATDSVTTVPSGTQSVSSNQLPASLGKKAAAQSVSVTLSGDEGALSVTSSGGALALDSSVQQLIAAIKESNVFESTVWFDPTTSPVTYYVRREILDQQTGQIAVTWTDMSGQAATPNLANLTSVSNAAQISTESVNYRASSAGTGYAIDDHLIHVYGLDADTSPPQLAYSFWFNATTGVVLSSAPSAGSYQTSANQSVSVTSSALPTNAAQETGGNLQAISDRLGDTAAAEYAGTGAGTINAILKSVRTKIYGVLNIRALSSSTDSVTVQGGNSTAVKTDGSAVTQPVSAAALPLPNGAATETGNLASIAQASGAGSDGAFSGTGNTTIVGALKGIYARLAGTLSIRALSSGTDSVTTVPSGTQAVSATSLPLPTGAASETGNLQIVAQAQGSSASGVTQPAGGAGVLGWLSGIYQRLSNTLTVNVSTLPSLPTGANTIGKVDVNNFPTTQAISAASLPLPTGAVSETGNIQTLRTVTGAQADAAYTGTGNATVISALKGLFAQMGSVLNIRALSSASDSVKVEGGNTAAVKTDGSAVTQPISASSLPLPTGAAQEAGGNLQLVAERATLIDNSVKATKSISTTTWVDPTVQPAVYYVRKETYNTSDSTSVVTWHTPTGATASPDVSKLVNTVASSGGGGGTLPSNLSQETGGNLESISVATGDKGDATYTGQILQVTTTRTPPSINIASRNVYDYGGTLQANIPPPIGMSEGDYWVIVGSEDNNTQHANVNLPSPWVKLQTNLIPGDSQSVALWCRPYSSDMQAVTLINDANDALAISFSVTNTSGPLAQQQLVNSTVGMSVSLAGLSIAVAEANSSILMLMQSDAAGGGANVQFTFPAGYAPNTRDVSDRYCAIGLSAVNDAAIGTYTSDGAAITSDVQTGGYISLVVWGPKVVTTQQVLEQDMTVISGIKGVYQKLKDGVAINVLNLDEIIKHRNLDETFTTTSAGVGYDVGDVLKKVVSTKVNLSGGLDVLETVWVNLTASTILTTPPNAAHIALAGGGGSSGSSTVQVSNFPATQAVSATALPLPTGAATEAGNIQTLRQTTGAVGDAAWAGSGDATVVAALKGMYNAINALSGSLGGTTTKKLFVLTVPSVPVGASRLYLDLFNGAAANTIIKVLRVKAIVDTDTAVTGTLGVELVLSRSTTIGTGGTAAVNENTALNAPTISSTDTTVTLPAGITARSVPAGSTAGAVLTRRWVFTEETNAASSLGQLAGNELLDASLSPLIIRNNQGIRIQQGAIASVGNIAFEIIFEVTP